MKEITTEFMRAVIEKCKKRPDDEVTGRIDGVYFAGLYNSEENELGVHIKLDDLED